MWYRTCHGRVWIDKENKIQLTKINEITSNVLNKMAHVVNIPHGLLNKSKRNIHAKS